MQCSLMLFAMLLTVASCGVRDHGDSVSSVSENKGSEAETNTGSNDEPEEPESGTVTVADFHYLEMQWQEEYVNKNDAVNKDWLYYAEPVRDETSEEGQFRECVFRNKISDVFEPEQFIVGAKNTPYILVNTLFLDGEGNCCVLWAEREEGSEEGFGEPTGYFLEKYSDTGEILLHVDYLPDVFGGMGESVTEGAAAEDGRLFLYRTGEEGVIFSFGADGSFEEVYTPELESLEGVAIGKDGAAYAYCVTGSSPKFAKLGEDGETYTCPKVPLQVYGGREDGVYLCDREGMWSYIPETGDVQKLWG